MSFFLVQTERESYKLCDTHFFWKIGSISVFQEVHASPQDEFLKNMCHEDLINGSDDYMIQLRVTSKELRPSTNSKMSCWGWGWGVLGELWSPCRPSWDENPFPYRQWHWAIFGQWAVSMYDFQAKEFKSQNHNLLAPFPCHGNQGHFRWRPILRP